MGYRVDSTAKLFDAYHKGDMVAREKLIMRFSKDAERIALEHSNLGIEDDDLIQIAYEGLIHVINGFSSKDSKNYKSYIVKYIRFFVRKKIADYHTFSYPKTPQNKIFSKVVVTCLQAKRDLILEFKREPSIEEISERAGINATLVEEVLDLQNRIVHLEDMSLDDFDEVIDGVSDPELEILLESDRQVFRSKIDSAPLKPKQREVLLYILEESGSLQDLATQHDRTHQDISALKKSALIKMKRSLMRYYTEMSLDSEKRWAVGEEIRFVNKRCNERMQNRHRY